MRIAVCDDETEIRDMLRDRICRFCPEADIETFQSGETLLAGKNQPDILFLDIRLPDMDGMEAARKLRRKNKRMILIFVTAVEEYVFQAFDVGAFHYLLKPVSGEKLQAVLAKAVEQYREAEADRTVKEEKSIVIKSGGVSNKVLLNEIMYAEVYNRKIIIHKVDGDVEYYGRLSELEKMAGEDFYRPHRAYLIHFRYVVKYDASMIWMEQGTALMSKQKYPEFVKSYLRYNKRKGGADTL